MFIGRTSLTGVTSFRANYEVSDDFVWEAQIRQGALPGWEGGWDLPPEQEAHVLKVLFVLFDKFLAEQDGTASGS